MDTVAIRRSHYWENTTLCLTLIIVLAHACLTNVKHSSSEQPFTPLLFQVRANIEAVTKGLLDEQLLHEVEGFLRPLNNASWPSGKPENN